MITCNEAKEQLRNIEVLKQSFDQAFDNYKKTRELESALEAQKVLEQAISGLGEDILFKPEKVRQELITWAETQLEMDTSDARDFVHDHFIPDPEKKEIICLGDLSIKNSDSLKTLPKKLNIHYRLTIRNCPSLKELPDDLQVGENVSILLCQNLTKLPASFGKIKILDIRGCSSLEQLPANLTSLGVADIRDCTSLRELPDDFTVRGSLYLDGCKSLEELPDNLNVPGELTLRDCPALTHLNNIKVGRDIYVDDSLVEEALKLKREGKIKGKVNP